jgi:sugar lactone lactonase YvrE
VKKLLQFSSILLGLVFAGGISFAQVASISYPGSPYSLPVSTAATIPAPTNTGGTINGSYTTATQIATCADYAFAITDDGAGNNFFLQNNGFGSTGNATIYKSVGGTVTTLTVTGATLNTPSAIGIDALGNLYVADNGNAVVYKFTLNAGKTAATLVATIGTGTKILGGIYDPLGIAFDGSNNVYIVDTQDGGASNGLVFRVAAGTTTLTSYITNLNNPYGVAVDASGNTYVSQNTIGTILKINGSTRTTVAGTYNQPGCLTSDASGDIFIADMNDGAVKEISAAGVATTLFTGVVYPTQVTFDNSRNMYIANENGNGNIFEATVNPVFFTISGTLPAGLTFNSATGAITGTTTAAVVAAAAHTVTAYNYAGTSTCVIIIGVNKATGVPTISYSPATFTFAQGTSITATFPAPTIGNAPTSYTFLGTVPTGLTFSTTTGKLSGTPTAYLASTNFVISANNTNGSGYTTISIAVTGTAPSLAYTATYTEPTNTAITITPTTTGTVTSTTISPTLPSGLVISSTGVISGSTNTTGTSGPYTVIPSNGATAGTANTFTITFAVAPAFSYTTEYRPVEGSTISLAPTVTAGSPTSYAETGSALGTLTFNTTTGTFGGTAAANTNTLTFVVTATNAAGLTAQYTVQIRPIAAAPFTYTSPAAYTVGVAITTLSPSVTTLTLATISPTLPSGLTMSASGQITGTPLAASAATVYTVFAYTTGGYYSSATVTITVNNPPAPAPSYSPSSYTFTVGTAATTSMITNTGGTATYSVDPSTPFPAYLTLNSSTGVITCVAGSTITALTTYKIDATNATATVSTTVNITVIGSTPPIISYSPSTYTFLVGTGGATSGITNTGGAATYTIDTSTPLPSYLTFNASTGVITCSTAGVVTPATSYQVDATNPSGSVHTSVTITINPALPVIAYSPATYTFTVGVSAATAAPNSTGGPVVTYSFDPATPAPGYLTINGSTGVITSTASSVAAAATNYTIDATNATGTGTTTVSITELATPSFTYSTPNNYVAGTAIPTLSPMNTGGAVAASRVYNTTGTVIINTTNASTISKPEGLAVDATGNVYVANFTGNSIIKYASGTVTNYVMPTGTGPAGLVFDSSGIPYVLGATSGSIIKFASGLAAAGTTIVTGLYTPQGIAIDRTDNIYVCNSATNPAGNYAISKYTTAGGTPTLTFNTRSTLYPSSWGITVDNAGNIWVADNDGVYLDEYNSAGAYVTESTRGTNSNFGLYTDGGGNAFFTSKALVYTYGADYGTLNQSINPPFSSARGVVTDGAGNLYVSDYTANTVTKFAPVSGYYLNGTLPAGLTFNSTTGAITGTPSAGYNGSYTVTAYNAAGPGTSNIFVINCAAPPTVAYTGSPYNYTVNTAITSLTPTTTGTPTGFSISPNLTTNTGLTFNTTTGVISGTPTIISSATTYTITATNSIGSSTTTISIAVLTLPNFSYTPASYYVDNSPITLSPVTTSGYSSVSAFAYGAGVALTTTGLNEPYGMAFDASGNLYVTNFGSGTVYKYAGGTGTPTSFITGLTDPTGIVFDATGNVYISQYNGYVYRYTAAGATKTTIITGGTGNATKPGSAYGLAIDASGNLYVADGNDGQIYKWTASTATNAIIIANGTTDMAAPVGVAVDAAGNIYSVDEFDDVIAKYTSAGVYSSTVVSSGLENPYSLYMDKSGNLYVGDTGTGDEYVYNSSGTLLSTLGGFNEPQGTAVDSKGDLFVSDYGNNTITEFPIVGGYTLNYASGTTMLPPGIIFDTTTGMFSGSPTTVFSGNYTVTGNDAIGSYTCTPFNINCVVGPTVAYTGSPFTYTVGTAITAITPTVTGSPTSLAISPNLTTNTGLSFNTTTGVISGTATIASAATTYTVTATGSGGITSTTTISITVVPAGTISYTPSTNNYTVGTAISPLVPTSTNIATQGFGAGIALTGGAPNEPQSVTVSASGIVLVADAGTGTILEYNAAGAYVTSFTTAATDAVGIVFDTAGNAYVASYNGIIYEYNTSLMLVATIKPGGAAVAGGVYGIAIDASNNLYVTSFGNGSVIKFTNTGTILATYTTGLNFPEGVTVDNSGNIYVLNYATNGTIVKLNSTGVVQSTYTGLNTPQVMATDQAGNLYVSVSGGVTEYSPSGTILNSITGLTFPFGVGLNSAGALYVTDEDNNTVTKYPPIGGYYLSGTLPPGLSFSSVTGTFSGTPTASWPSTIYTVTAYNLAGSPVTTTVTIKCTVTPFVFTYTTPNVYPVNAAITPLAPNITSGAISGLSFGTGSGLTGGTLSKPEGVGINPTNGDIYVANFGGPSITQYGPTGAYIATITTNIPAKPTDIAFDAAGDAFIVSSAGVVYKYTGGLAGTETTFLTGLSNNKTVPLQIAIDGNNNIYVVSSTGVSGTGNSVNEYATSGATAGTSKLSITSTNLANPSGIAVDASGNIYVSNSTANTVYEYSATNTGGTLVLSTVTLSTPEALAVDAAGNLYISNFGNSTVDVVNPAQSLTTLVTSFTAPNPKGITVATNGTVYASDYTDNSIIAYPPYSGYYLTGALPPGLSFNTTTGTFTGTPTAVWPQTTYTVTGYSYGVASTATLTIQCVVSYDWVGTTSTDWNTPNNWLSQTVPGATNTANIGVNVAFTNQPNVGSAGGNAVAAVQIGNTGGQAVTLTVTSPYTLAVTGNITVQSDANASLGYTTETLAGTGIITAANLAITANTTQATPAVYTETVASSITSLQLSGNIALTSAVDGSGNALNAQFNLTGGVTTLTSTGLLTTANGSTSTSTFNLSGGTLQVAAPTFLANLSASGTNVVTLGTASVIQYSGAAQTVYTTTAIANLSGGAGLSYGGIAFSGTGIKTPAAGGNLNVSGSFTNTMINDASDYVSLAATPVFFNGAAAQSLAGGAGDGTVFSTVTFTGSTASTMASGLFYVASTGSLTMAGSSSLNAGGFLTLNSDATGSASVAQVPTGCNITGTVNVQRYISGERGYRLLSSPVYAGSQAGNNIYSINYLVSNPVANNNLYLTGPGFAATAYTAAGNPTVFLYDEGFTPLYTTFYNSNFIAISSLSGGTGTDPTYAMYSPNGATTPVVSGGYNIPVGNGYYCFFRGNFSEGVPTLTNPNNTTILPATVVASGTLNIGQVQFADWYTPGSHNLGGISQNYNLVGNPYASAIDLASIQGTVSTTGIYITPYNGTTGIAKFIYELNPISGSYGIYTYDGTAPATNSASEFIASGEGFLVQAYGTTSTLTFNESAKAGTTNADAQGEMARRVANFNPVKTNPLLVLKVTGNSVSSDETILSFNQNASSKYVFNEDAPHRAGVGIVGISSMSSDNLKMAINTMPVLSNMTIPLNVNASVSGLYNIALNQMAPLPSIYEVWLKDAYLKDSLDIKDNPTYNFDINTADTNSFGSNRFSLVIRENPALMVHLLSFNATKAIAGVNVLWTTENEQNYTNFAVERSTNGGTTFTDLGGFASSAVGAYTYLDKNPVVGADMYRLKIIDLTGAVTYSSVVTIMYANTATIALNGQMLVYPNPTAGMVNLSIQQTNSSNVALASSASYKIEIVNNLGIVVRNAVSATPTWSSDVTSLLPGTYFINVVNASNNAIVGKSAFVKL